MDCHITSLIPKTVSYQRQITTYTTAPLVNPLYTYCALNRVYLHSYPTDTTGSLSRVYNHYPTTAINHYFRLSCIHLQSFVRKASSPFRNPSTKLLHCWCHKYYVISIQQLGGQTTSFLTGDNIHKNSGLIHTQLPQSPSYHLPREKCLFQIHKSIVHLLLLRLVFLLYLSHDENGISGSLARHEAKLHVMNWHLTSDTFIGCSGNLIALYEPHKSRSHFPLYTCTRILSLQSSGILLSLTMLLMLLLFTHTSMLVWRCPSILWSDETYSSGFLTRI